MAVTVKIPTQLRAVAERYDVDFSVPFQSLTEEQQRVVLDGAGDEQFNIAYTYKGRTVAYQLPTWVRGARLGGSPWPGATGGWAVVVIASPSPRGQSVRPALRRTAAAKASPRSA